ncbi:MAG: GntR family transcriptional regulator [Pirellulales bacterium]|nr:GntR family transcriptional regulator [Pirellulales bacterium]
MTAYSRIAGSIRERVLSGNWQPGHQLPTERELCNEYGASRITIRRALQILEQERLLDRRQGVGTFVNSTASKKIPIINTDFFGSISRYAPELTRRLERSARIQVDQQLAEVFGVCVGDPLLTAVRVDSIRDEPVIMDEVSILGRYGERLTNEDLGELDFLSLWQKVENIELDYCSQTIEAVPAERAVARRLHCRPGSPILRETVLLYITGGQAAGLFVSFYRHECFRFDATVSISIS